MAAGRRLEGMACLVTGAAGGIGRATCARLADDGARVAANDLVAGPGLDEVVARTGGVPAPGDVADPRAVERLVDEAAQALGPVEALVANHAAMTMAPFLEHDAAEWWRIVEVNLSGTFLLVRAVLPHMRRLGRGRIVLVSSEWGITGWPNATAYAASKAGLVALGKTLARELGPEGIVTSVVAPGIVDTPQLEVDARDAGVSRAEIVERYGRDMPVGRVGRPEDVAATIAMLLAPGSEALVGQVIHPNGGTTRVGGA